MKHVKVDLHFIRDRVALGQVRVLHVPTTSQYANIFTKVPTSVFQEFRSSLNVRHANIHQSSNVSVPRISVQSECPSCYRSDGGVLALVYVYIMCVVWPSTFWPLAFYLLPTYVNGFPLINTTTHYSLTKASKTKSLLTTLPPSICTYQNNERISNS
jgi:hypothetical protein